MEFTKNHCSLHHCDMLVDPDPDPKSFAKSPNFEIVHVTI